MLRCRLVTFDVVNTLLKVVGSPGHQYADVARQHGLDVEHSDISSFYRPIYTQMKLEYPNYGMHNNLRSKDWWDMFVRRLFRQICECPDHILTKITNTLWHRFSEGNNWEVLPDRVTVLQQLKDKGLHLGVISNFDERLERTLKVQKLHTYFDFFVTVPSVGCEKPNPKMFMAGIIHGRVAPHEALHVGDDIHDDYFGAKRAGMHAFLLDPGSHFAKDYEKYGIEKDDLLRDIRQLPERVIAA